MDTTKLEKMKEPLLLTRCQIGKEISAEVFVYGVPTVAGMDHLIDILVMLRNSWRELNDEVMANGYTAN